MSKIRIVLKSLDHRLLDSSVANMIRFVKQEKVNFDGPIPLPIKRRRWTVNKSPHIYKTARNQYEKTDHSRLIYVESNNAFIKSLSNFHMPAGVEVNISLGSKL